MLVNGKNGIDLDTSRTPSPVMNNNNDKVSLSVVELAPKMITF